MQINYFLAQFYFIGLQVKEDKVIMLVKFFQVLQHVWNLEESDRYQQVDDRGYGDGLEAP